MSQKLARWQLKAFELGTENAGSIAADTGSDWIDVAAPGDTYLALIDAGRIDHPFQQRHESGATWVRDKEWWWRTEFEADACVNSNEQVRLVFEGLDTFAEIYLDGSLVGRTDNMFRTYKFDIGDRLLAGGTHSLAICFAAPAAVMADRETPAWTAFTDRVTVSKRNLMRKAQFGWGWDWGPDLPTVGIWKTVCIERRSGAAIADVHSTILSVSAELAEARVTVEVERAGAGSALRLVATLTDPDGREAAHAGGDVADTTTLQLTIPKPRLWWTADLGEQPLYTLTVRLFDGAKVVDQQSRLVGLRTIALDTSDDPDEPGTSFFRFVLNGVPLFAKGVCWVPATSFVADVDADRYRDLIERAAEGNMNMIRIWGGGIYEPDLFYDLCDEAGVLVWQDFMFACANYPEDDPAFVDNVKAEITDQVRRLRNHPCLAVWCGNNENQAMQYFNNQLTGGDERLRGLIYYDEIMPAMLAELDPHTPYWPSSPSGGRSPNSMMAGDVHNWTVWHGIPLVPDDVFAGGYDRSPEGVAYTRYAEDNCRFVSEFGIQAAPAMSTLRRWMAPEDLVLGSEGLLGRVKDSPDKANAMMATVTGLPRTLEDYVDFSMWTQAEGMKFGIEHFRRRKPHCSGALIWQYNDCWPCVSWSLIDYDGVAKASWFATRRAFAPVMASFKPLGDDSFALWVTNDRLEPVAGQAAITLTKTDGGAVWTETIDYAVAANTSAPVWSGTAEAADNLVLTVRSPESRFSPNRYLLAPISRLALKSGAKPTVSIEQTRPTQLHIRLSPEHYLAFVHASSERADLRFDDNYFDLAAGETATIVVTSPAGLTAKDVTVSCWNARGERARN